MSKTKTFRAGQMSMVLIGIMVVMLLLLIGGSLLAGKILLSKSSQTTHAQIDADISAGDTARLEELKTYLANNAAGIAQTKALTAGLGQYTQTSIVATISGYANKSGVTITNFDFGSSAAAPAAGAAAATPATTSTTSGGTVNLTLASPVSYQKFIVFLRLVEQGLMPAQVTNAQITGDPDNPGNVSVSSLTIQVVQ